jgi:hypothetical protein
MEAFDVFTAFLKGLEFDKIAEIAARLGIELSNKHSLLTTTIKLLESLKTFGLL